MKLLHQPRADVNRSQVWDNVEGYKVDLDAVRSWGVPLISLDQFIAQHGDRFLIG